MLYQKGAIVLGEIHDQPRAWKKTLDDMARRRAEVSEWLKAQNFGQVIYVGCSDSLNMAASAARITHLVSGLNSVALPASEVLYARRPPYDSRIKTLVLGLARADEAEETGWALEKLRAGDPRCQVLTIEAQEPALAGLAHMSIGITELQEEAKVATRSVSSLLLASLVTVSWLANKEPLLAELQRLPDLLQYKALQTKAQGIVQSKPSHFAFLGSGPFYGVACQGALNMREMAGVPCEHQYLLEYRYGNHGSLTNLMMVVGLISNTFRLAEEKVLGDLAVTRAQRVAVADEIDEGLRSKADHVLELKAGVSEISRVLLTLPALQLLAFYMAMSKGVNPDHPKHLEHPILKLKERPGATPA